MIPIYHTNIYMSKKSRYKIYKTNQNKQNVANNIASSEIVPEYILHATISKLTENEIVKYSHDKVSRNKVICQICGVEYSKSIASKCPVCAINEKMAALTLGMIVADNGVIKAETNKESIKDNKKMIDNSFKMPTHNYRYGDIIRIGSFDGMPIEWQIIQVKGNELLVLSKCGIEAKAYHSKSGSVTWETSTIRQYLNNEFFSKCFDIKEQKLIQTTSVKTNDNVLTGVSGGKDTSDRLFLLSIDEVKMMFNSDQARKCHVTESAKNNGAFADANTGTGWWWLRTPGENDIYAAYVSADGVIVKGGCYTGSSRGLLRPAMWVDGNAKKIGRNDICPCGSGLKYKNCCAKID